LRRGAIRNWSVHGRAPDCAPDRRRRVGENEPVSGRTRAFAVLSAVLVLAMVGYVGVAIVRGGNAASGQASAASANRADHGPPLATLLRHPHVLFLQPSLTARPKNELVVAPLAAPGSS